MVEFLLHPRSCLPRWRLEADVESSYDDIGEMWLSSFLVTQDLLGDVSQLEKLTYPIEGAPGVFLGHFDDNALNFPTSGQVPKFPVP